MKLKKFLGMALAAVMMTGVMAAVSVSAEETDEDATADMAASSTWDEATMDSATADKSIGSATTSPNTGAGTALAVILACGGFAGAGIGVKKLKK